MKFQYILVLLIFGVFLFGCTIGQQGIIGTWRTSSLGGELYLTFSSNGTGVIQSGLGNVPFEYTVVNSTQIKYKELVNFMGKAPQETTVDYKLVNENTLIFNNMTLVRYTGK